MKRPLVTTPQRQYLINTSALIQPFYPSNDDGNHMTFASAYHHHDVAYVLWLVTPPVLLVLGCYGNVMTIAVMRGLMKRTSDSTGCLSVYFVALALSDLCLLCTNFLFYWPGMALDFPLAYHDYPSCTLPFFVSYVFSMTSAWYLVAMTCQRMMSVVVPHRVKFLCTLGTGKIVTVAILVIACAENLYIFLYLRVEYLEGGYVTCVYSDKYAGDIFNILNFSLASLIPFTLLIVSNSMLIVQAVKSAKTRIKMAQGAFTETSSRLSKVSSMTTTLFMTSAAFLLLTSPSCILLIYFDMIGYFEGEVEDDSLNERLVFAETVCVLLWMSNCCVNFYIYVLSGRKFREEAKRYMGFCLKQTTK